LPIHYDGDEDEEVKAMEAEDSAVEDGSTDVSEILKDELPKDAGPLSVVKKVGHSIYFLTVLFNFCYFSSASLSTRLLYPSTPTALQEVCKEAYTGVFDIQGGQT